MTAAAVPTDATAWCQEVERLALLCATAPTFDRVTRLRALIDNPPGAYLPNAWERLITGLRRYIEVFERGLPRFDGRALLDSAAAVTPQPAPPVALPYVD